MWPTGHRLGMPGRNIRRIDRRGESEEKWRRGLWENMLNVQYIIM